MNQRDFKIYPLTQSDIRELKQLSIDTFDETFSATNSRENMEHYFNRSFNEDILSKELRNPESHFYFITSDGDLAGYLKFNIGEAQTELKEQSGFEVERIYILKKFYGTGAGAALMDFALEQAQLMKKEYLWLGVHEENYRALRFYEKYGFFEFSEHTFMMGKQPQRDLLLKKVLD